MFRLRLLPAIASIIVVSLTVALAKPNPKYVFIISFDQGGDDAIEKADNMPAFHEMVKEGASTWNAQTIHPSITLPAHTSMLTGLDAPEHGIASNGHKEIVAVPTIFSLAKAKGLRTAMYYSWGPLGKLIIPDTVDRAVMSGSGHALKVAADFAEDLKGTPSNLTFLYIYDLDKAGHGYGKYSPEWIKARETDDNALKTIREAIKEAGIEDESVILMTADHGAHAAKNKEGRTVAAHGSNRPEDMRIPWIAWGEGVKHGYAIQQPVTIYDTGATALWLLNIDLPANLKGKPVAEAFED